MDQASALAKLTLEASEQVSIVVTVTWGKDLTIMRAPTKIKAGPVANTGMLPARSKNVLSTASITERKLFVE